MPEKRNSLVTHLFVSGQEPLALLPSAITQRYGSFWDDGDDKGYDCLEGGVAVLAIDGPLAQRGGWWWDGYESISKKFKAALDDRTVQAILLRIDSPGGAVAGCFEACRAMRAMADATGKPVIAYVDEMACSAAYALACVADSIVMPETGVVGSVGVITALWDISRALDEAGITVRVITSGARKADGRSDVPMSDEAVKKVQSTIDYLAGLFGEWVAERRPFDDAAAVLALEADVFWGAEGVTRQLADQVGSFDQAVALTSARAAQQRKTRMFNMIAVALGLPENATEAEIAHAATTLTADRKRLLGATGATTVDGAVGAIDAGKAAHVRLAEIEKEAADKAEAERLAAKKAAEEAAAAEHASLVAQLPPGQRDWGASQSTDYLKGYIKAAPGPALGKQITRESQTKSGEGHRRWEDLKPMEKHQLKENNPEEYNALLDDARSRGVVAGMTGSYVRKGQ
jgi:capsid assembly protease